MKQIDVKVKMTDYSSRLGEPKTVVSRGYATEVLGLFVCKQPADTWPNKGWLIVHRSGYKIQCVVLPTRKKALEIVAKLRPLADWSDPPEIFAETNKPIINEVKKIFEEATR